MATQPGFIFGGDTDWTYEQLQNKRRIAEALAAQIGSPRTVGQGLSAVGKALAARGINKRADKREGELREDFNEKWDSLFGGGMPTMSTMGGGVRGPAPVTTRTEADLIGDDVMTALGRDPGFEDWNARIRRVETGGEADPWAARGPVVERGMYAGEQAIGPNQIMPGNIAEWGAMAGIDPQWQNADALAAAIAEGNPEARAAYDAIVLDQYNRMAEKGYTPEQKASVWFTGSPTPNPNVSDGFTSASEYVSRFGGAGGGQPTMSARNGQSFDIATLAEVAGSPLASPGQRAVAQALLQQQMQNMDPMRAMEMERARLELEQLRNPTPDLPSSVEEYNFAVGQGFPGTYQDWITAKAEAGRPSTEVRVENNMPGGASSKWGDPPKDSVWLLDENGEVLTKPGPDGIGVVPISAPIGNAQELAQEGEKDRQGALKLGTTLQSIHENLLEIDDGGLPVTGAAGDFRRTWVGRALTGNDAFDFGNRTNQITDSAAFAEIQNMRDNSPTGGAVGQLTDKERAAIGNAVTALNSSTSWEEYVRAAENYRKVALDIAFKDQGTWELDPKTGVVILTTPDGQVIKIGEPVQRTPTTTGSGGRVDRRNNRSDGLSESDLQWLNQQ